MTGENERKQFMTTTNINGNAWTFNSIRVPHGIAAFGHTAGLCAVGCARLVKAVQGAIRRDIRENGCTVLDTQTAAGKPKQIKAKEFDPKQKRTGKGDRAALTWRTGEQILLGNCSMFTRRLTAQDEALANLESDGAGIEYVPVLGSVEANKLSELASLIVSQLAAEKEQGAKQAAEKSAAQAAKEAAELAALNG